MGFFSFLKKKKTKFVVNDEANIKKAKEVAAKSFKSKSDRLEANLNITEAINEVLVKPCRTDEISPEFDSYFDEMELMDEEDKKLARFKK